jgi:Permuted papain-like amidase enzyme, YaeF/YiiX, C92 family
MKYILLIVFLATVRSTNAQSWKDFHFQSGDILFQDLDCGDLCDAIEAVTPALNAKHFSHLGLVYAKRDSVFVIEAIGNDVHLTSISKFLQRQVDDNDNPKVVVGRLKKMYQHLNDAAINFALGQLGKEYDNAFIYNNGKYYCSELIYDAYKTSNGGIAFFKLYPMTFNDPKTKKPFPAWEAYYKNLRMNIPEGLPGCNPGSIATSDKIDILKSFY